MKKILLVSMLSLLGLISCNSCVKNDVPINPPEPPPQQVDASIPDATVDNSVSVNGPDWSFSLPSHDWVAQHSDGGTDAMLVNDQEKNLVLFLKEEFPGTTQDYALFAIQGMREAGATLVGSSMVVINGTNFVLVESNKGAVRVFQWVTVKNKTGYGLSCGGLDADSHQRALCMGVVNTLTIK